MLQLGVKNASMANGAARRRWLFTGDDSLQGDLIGRFSYVRLSKGFEVSQ